MTSNNGACIGITVCAAFLEVASTMVLAYPEHKAKQRGEPQSSQRARLQVAANVVVMLSAVALYTVGSWYGPVSISVPAAMAGKLMWNLISLWPILRMQIFSKEEQTGTFIMICSIVALPGVGPSDQPDLDIIARLSSPESVAWLMLLSVATLAACGGMFSIYRGLTDEGPRANYAILLTAQVTTAVLGTSVGKTFALVSGWNLFLAIVLNGVIGVVNLLSMQLAATKTDQGLFVPLQSITTLVVNMITGLIVWQDWRTIVSATSYVAVYFLMFLGTYILAPVDFLRMYQKSMAIHHVLHPVDDAGARDEFQERLFSARAKWKAASAAVLWHANATGKGAADAAATPSERRGLRSEQDPLVPAPAGAIAPEM